MEQLLAVQPIKTPRMWPLRFEGPLAKVQFDMCYCVDIGSLFYFYLLIGHWLFMLFDCLLDRGSLIVFVYIFYWTSMA